MRLIKCYIENYGKLSNFSYNFTDGLNVIEQENGWGKSTFASFIKAMLFGLEYKTGKTITERKRYMPWNGNRFGGNLEFEINSKVYRVERYFGVKEKDDTFALYDMATNEKSEDFSDNIGSEIWDLDRDSYEKTAFVSLENNELLSEIIQKKLGGIDEKNVDLERFDQAEAVLTNLLSGIKGKRKNTGKIGELESKQIGLKNSLKEAHNAQISIELINNRIKEAQDELSELQKQMDRVDEELSKFSMVEKKRAYDQIAKQVDEMNKEVDELLTFFNMHLPMEEQVDYLVKLVSRKLELDRKLHDNNDGGMGSYALLFDKYGDKQIEESKIATILNYFEHSTELAEKIEKVEAELNRLKEENENKKQSYNKKILVIGVFLFAVTVGLAFVSPYIAIPFGAISLVGMFVYNLKRKKSVYGGIHEVEHNEDILKSYQQQNQKLLSDVLEIIVYFGFDGNNIMSAVSAISSEYNEFKRLSAEVEKSKSEVLEITKKLEEIFCLYFEEYPDDEMNAALIIRNKLTSYYLIAEQYKSLSEQKLKYEQENDIKVLKEFDLPTVSEQELKEERSRYLEKIIRLRETIVGEENHIQNLSLIADSYEDIEANIENNQNEIEVLKKNYSLVEITKNALKTARDNLASKYMKPMSDAFFKYYSEIDVDKEDDYKIDIGLNVKVDEQGSYHESEYLSSGKKDMVELCMRFALIEAVYEKTEKPVLILDDPFINLDSKKTKNAVKLLDKLSERYQLVYFICHESRQCK